MNRLSAATKKSSAGTTLESYQYVYDPVGNLTSEMLNGVTTTMTYNGANQLIGANGTTYTFDLAGGQTGNSAGQSLAYNAAGQTASITPPAGSPLTLKYSGTGQNIRVQAGATTYEYDLGGIDSLSNGGGTTFFTKL